tara:strand:+ start:702 stop:815 length:114 start_codon:yes stop_codon:yes gene_type:complete
MSFNVDLGTTEKEKNNKVLSFSEEDLLVKLKTGQMTD